MIATALLAAALLQSPPQPLGPNRYDPVCDGREATQAELFENRVRQLQDWRRAMGMPSSRAHIVALLHSKAAAKRSQRLDSGLDGPVTVREYRYLKKRAAIDIADPYKLTTPYFQGKIRAYYSGIGIVDDWPRSPKLGVWVTRHVAKVQRDLTKRAKGAFLIKVLRARYSLRELQAKQEAIDWKALAAEGIEVVSTGIGDDEVHVDASSSRPDAKRVIEERYGPGVVATIWPPLTDYEVCVPVSTYTVSPDGLYVTVKGTSDGSSMVRLVVSETSATVSIGAVVLFPARDAGELETEFSAEATLTTPLGSRAVLDGETGESLSQSTGSS